MDGRRVRGKSYFNLARVALLMLAACAGPGGAAARGQAMGREAIDIPASPGAPAPSPAATVPANPLPLPASPAVIETPQAITPEPPAVRPASVTGGLNMTLPPIHLEGAGGPALDVKNITDILTTPAHVGIGEGKPVAAVSSQEPLPASSGAALPPAAASAAPGPNASGAAGNSNGPAGDAANSLDRLEHSPIRGAVAATKPGASPPVSTGVPAAASGTAPRSFALPTGISSAAQVGGALAIVIGLIFIAKAAARKWMPGAKTQGGKGVIEILARHPLAKNQSIVLVRIGSQIVALNQGKEASESVLVISEPGEVAKIIGQIEGKNPSSIQAGFTKLLANARMDLERDGTDGENEREPEVRNMDAENLDEQLEEMAAAKRQLMELRQHVRSVRDSLPRA